MQNNSNSIDWSAIVGYWGALLSTFLAVRTLYIGRVRIYASLDLNVSIDGYFTVRLTNLTPKTIFINYYNFFFDNKSTGEIDVGLYENCHISLTGRSITPIYIEHMYIDDFKKKGTLFVELYITGRSKPKKVIVSI